MLPLKELFMPFQLLRICVSFKPVGELHLLSGLSFPFLLLIKDVFRVQPLILDPKLIDKFKFMLKLLFLFILPLLSLTLLFWSFSLWV